MLFFCMFLAVGIVSAQDEYITIMDFETGEIPGFSGGWDMFMDFSATDEPVHGGETSLLIEVNGGTGAWSFGTWTFPETVDLSSADEVNIWVYADDVFRMNLEFGGSNLGYREYGEEDLESWKKLVWWFPEEAALEFTETWGWGTFVNPAASGIFPEDFIGTMYWDDLQARVRKTPPAREYLLVNGFNSDADLATVTVNPDFDGGIDTAGDPPPPEGDGFLVVYLSEANNERFAVDLTDVPEVAQYDRFHFDVFMDGSASWGNFGWQIRTTLPDAAGNDVGLGGLTLVNGSYSSVATQQWHSFTAQYGPVEGTDGFAFQTLREDSIAPVYKTEGASLEVYFTTNGGGVEGMPMYIDNLRISRAVGTGVGDWDLY